MKTNIHPNYVKSTVTCGCGNEFETRSTQEKMRGEICSECHPFYTGKQKFVDTAGRIQKFKSKYAWTAEKAKEAATVKKQETASAEQGNERDTRDFYDKVKEAGKSVPKLTPIRRPKAEPAAEQAETADA